VSLGFPGDFGKETDRNETCFLYKTPPGPRRRYAPKGPERTLGAQRFPGPLVMKVAMIISAPVSGLFSRSVRIFFRGQLQGASDLDYASLRRVAGDGPARGPLRRSWKSGRQLLGGDPRVASNIWPRSENTFCGSTAQRDPQTLAKFAYIARPTFWLFSGWNWQAIRLSRQTAAANGVG
jgi:hypothetical protein